MEPARRKVEMWRDRLATVARNVADLGETDDLRRIRARLASPEPYEGMTLAEARRVVAALDALWADYLLLSRAIDEAAELSRRSLLHPARDAEAAALLDGASIRLPAVAVPVRARGLLDAAERHAAVTPVEVLDAMVASFDAARRGVAAIASAETAGRIKLGALQAEPAARDPALAARLDAATRAFDRDPLSAADTLAVLAAALAARRASAEAFARARDDLDALEAERRRSRAARAEAETLVVIPLPPDDVGADLAAWLDRLRATADEGRADAAALGLKRWSADCAAARAVLAAGDAALARLTSERDDLRGRFRALAAKAKAVTPRGGDPGSAAELAAEVERRPFDAARVRPLLLRFEASLGASPRPMAI